MGRIAEAETKGIGFHVTVVDEDVVCGDVPVDENLGWRCSGQEVGDLVVVRYNDEPKRAVRVRLSHSENKPDLGVLHVSEPLDVHIALPGPATQLTESEDQACAVSSCPSITFFSSRVWAKVLVVASKARAQCSRACSFKPSRCSDSTKRSNQGWSLPGLIFSAGSKPLLL